MSENEIKKTALNEGENNTKETENYSLNDDRRVKVLSPGALVAKRFFRNRLAVTGMVILIFMFLFSFVGGLVSPYGQDQKFYRYDVQTKDYAGIIHNEDLRYVAKDADLFKSSVQAQAFLNIQRGNSSFSYGGNDYTIEKINDDFYVFYAYGEIVGIGSRELVNSSDNSTLSFDMTYNSLMAKAKGEKKYTSGGVEYNMGEDGVVTDASNNEVAYVSQYIVRPIMSDVFFTREFKDQLIEAVEAGKESFEFKDENGQDAEYILKFNPATKQWDVKKHIETRVFDTYSFPSKEHWLCTDSNGMDMLTRLMYGGRISLIIGFVAVAIESIIGVIMGGIAGYFGGWVDGVIMRLVDIFYCIPSMPLFIILGAAMDADNVPPMTRMMYLMLILGFLGWAGTARLVRGQILSLREQEFMTATEAGGIAVSRRIFRHLIPNVMPQLIVVMTMGLGSTIITEATLSFLGLGVRFPFASWGNIINDVNDTFVLTNYWFIWIPAGVLLLVTVLAFNIVGDGLRDAFDPKMKR